MLRRVFPTSAICRAAATMPACTAAARAFSDKGNAKGDNGGASTNIHPYGDNTREVTLEKMVEYAASGQYAEHKPRAVMFVNKRPVEIIPNEENLLEVMEREGIRVPKFCYHPVLSVAGNCRMCLVQVDGTQNVIVACATVALPGMSILSDTRLVRDAREGNVELILINHPNDCPICEQATNCDLQHITMNYGSDAPRYREDKKAVNDFYFDPYTRVVLNRCIHCTRCVRFLNEHTQDFNLGMIGRGGLSEIGTYMEELEVKTEFSQGAAQLCPVGSLNAASGSDITDAELDAIDAALMNATPMTSSSGVVADIASA
jgi:NADH dehydrogenase (ubiquinone) Fe-S protein 1